MDQCGLFSMVKSENHVAGACLLPVAGGNLSAAAGDVYRQIFEILDGLPGMRLFRMWNYVPFINDQRQELENYRHFNIGRWEAFRSRFGEAAGPNMPAATAVGIAEPVLAVTFQAGTMPVTYIENPEQLPAYEYPEEHGPRPPSFSRGAVVSDSRCTAYLSGTASVKGHKTVGGDSLDEQIRTALDNVSIVRKCLGIPASGIESAWRAYVRDAADSARVLQALQSSLADGNDDTLLVLEAAICRAPLRVELEGVFRW